MSRKLPSNSSNYVTAAVKFKLMIQQDERSSHALTQLITDFSQYLAEQCSTKCPTFDHIIVHKKGFQSHYINSKINLEDSSLFCLATDAPVFGLRAISSLGFTASDPAAG